MARPVKTRRVCDLPEKDKFGPIGFDSESNKIVEMAVDEYETIRLIDYEHLTQEECAEHMNIARATVQRIYANAREKIAICLVSGKVLNIQGGNYKLCKSSKCENKKCGKRNKQINLGKGVL